MMERDQRHEREVLPVTAAKAASRAALVLVD
jgi:hypothetical protein